MVAPLIVLGGQGRRPRAQRGLLAGAWKRLPLTAGVWDQPRCWAVGDCGPPARSARTQPSGPT